MFSITPVGKMIFHNSLRWPVWLNFFFFFYDAVIFVANRFEHHFVLYSPFLLITRQILTHGNIFGDKAIFWRYTIDNNVKLQITNYWISRRGYVFIYNHELDHPAVDNRLDHSINHGLKYSKDYGILYLIPCCCSCAGIET